MYPSLDEAFHADRDVYSKKPIPSYPERKGYHIRYSLQNYIFLVTPKKELVPKLLFL